VSETIDILMGLKPRFEQHHGVLYSNDAIRAAAELAAATSTNATCPTRRSTSSTKRVRACD
jgi:ATP-dependent Clp protease ATP-binding subunit ClpA